VLEAADGPAAIEVFRRQPEAISCVLLDLSMPHMGGIEVYHHLRAIRSDLRVVLTSGYSGESGVGELTAVDGLAGFIQKPYTSEALFREVDRALRPS
jgi:CheY-like chemotaxis protein